MALPDAQLNDLVKDLKVNAVLSKGTATTVEILRAVETASDRCAGEASRKSGRSKTLRVNTDRASEIS